MYVRRGALGALTAVGDEAFGRRLPRYFHADDFNIRSQAVSGSRAYALKPGFENFFEGCWLGVLRDETESNLAFDSALGGLRDRAGTIVGVPDAVMADPKGRSERMIAFRKELYEEGESYGLDRITWVDTWFDWWAKQLGLESQEERDAALAARRAFWDAARAGDVAAARAGAGERAVRRRAALHLRAGLARSALRVRLRIARRLHSLSAQPLPRSLRSCYVVAIECGRFRWITSPRARTAASSTA